MTNSITKTTILDNSRNLVILVNVVGDGSGEETDLVIFDRSTFAPTTGTAITVARVDGRLEGFAATLEFEATTDLPFAQLPDGPQFFFEWPEIGGLSSEKAGTGTNGDINITTAGLGNGDRGTFVISLLK